MDRNEYLEIVEDIRDAHRAGDMKSVLRFAGELDLTKIRETPVLEMIADAYWAEGDIPMARDMLIDAYGMTSKGRTIAYRLAEICIETGNIKDAVNYYSDFCKVAPKDSRKYILKYDIAKAGGVENKELIKILEQYTSLELDEKYIYELAKLYREEGEEDKCIETCDSLVMWYSDGEYVEKALELKQKFSELSPRQQQMYETIRKERKLKEAADVKPAAAKEAAVVSDDSLPDYETAVSEESGSSEKTEEAEEAAEAEETVAAETPDEPAGAPEDEEYEGVQMTIDEVFAQYAQKLKEHKDETVSIDAERLKQIQEAVDKTVNPTPVAEIDEEEEASDVDIKVYQPENPQEDIAETLVVEEKSSSFFDFDDDYFDDYDNEESEDAEGNEPEDPDSENAAISDEESSEESSDSDDYDEPYMEKKEIPEGYLSDEMCEEAAEYLMIEGMEEKLSETIEDIVALRKRGVRNGGNLIITGEAKSGKTYLTLAVIKEINRKVGSGTGRVAKVQAESLNGKNISKVLGRVSGSDLIIENAGLLEDKTVSDIINVLKSEELDSMISIEDNLLAIESLTNNFPEIEKLFKNRIDIHELSISQWAEVACDYAAEMGYFIGDIALLALHARIDEKNIAGARLGMDDIIDIVENAIDNAEARGGLRRRGRKKRGLIELTEADFM